MGRLNGGAMTKELLEQQRVRSARARRAMPVLWRAVALYGIASGAKVFRALQIANSHDLTWSDAMALLTMENTERLRRTFAGHEAVFVDYATSALVGIVSVSLAILLLALRGQALRRESAMLACQSIRGMLGTVMSTSLVGIGTVVSTGTR
jgi:hypothetical protein